MVNASEVIAVIFKITIFIFIAYYLYIGMFPTLSEVDGDPSEKRDIPISVARRHYLQRYVKYAMRGPTSALMKKYIKSIYNYEYEFRIFADNSKIETIFNDDAKNQQLVDQLRDTEYQQVLKFNTDQKHIYKQLILIFDPKVNNTMLNRFLMKRPEILYNQPDKFRVDYT